MRPQARESLATNFVAFLLKRFTVSITLMLALPGLAQQVTVDITPGHSTNFFSPLHGSGLASIAIR